MTNHEDRYPADLITVAHRAGYGVTVTCACGWRLNLGESPVPTGAFKGDMPAGTRRAREHNSATHGAKFDVVMA